MLRLFPRRLYDRYGEVPLGRKRIDLCCVPKLRKNPVVAVELKLQDWRKALWQATINFQLCNQSYIALWHQWVHRVENHLDLLEEYGVGLIVVRPRVAEFVRASQDRVIRIARKHKPQFYRLLAERL